MLTQPPRHFVPVEIAYVEPNPALIFRIGRGFSGFGVLRRHGWGLLLTLSALRGPLPAKPADLDHMRSISANPFAALAAGIAGLVGRKLMRGPFLVGRYAAAAGDLSLPLAFHRCKAART